MIKLSFIAKDLKRHFSDNRYMRKNQWLRDRLKQLGKKNADLAAALGWDRPNTVTDIIKGDRQIKSFEIPGIAACLQMTEADVIRLFGNLNSDVTISPVQEMAELFSSLPPREQGLTMRFMKDLAETAGSSPKGT
jgi:hypothetical protein